MAFQIANGLGAGNIGEELIARAFWSRIRGDVILDVAVFPESAKLHQPYPPSHRYITVNLEGSEEPPEEVNLGVIVGTTPVTEREGLQWPLGFMAQRLHLFHERGIPVHVVGAGIDRLDSAEALSLFREAFLPICSWTVRSSRCREALLAMGVAPERVIVGADWAWLYRPQATDLSCWAAGVLSRMGLDLSRPLVAVNVVNLVWKDDERYKRALAGALTSLSRDHGLQPFFFCNECRDGDDYDAAAARQVASLMPAPPPVAPNLYYSPEEAIALISRAQLSISFRYHFTVFSVLAGVVPVTVARSQKMVGLVEDLELPLSCTIEKLTAPRLVEMAVDGFTRRETYNSQLAARRKILEARAEANLAFLPELDSAPRTAARPPMTPQPPSTPKAVHPNTNGVIIVPSKVNL
jgi:polysaccharide pyruvyl transferase WcaK-like protein